MHVCGIRFNAERAEKKLKSHYPNISVSSMTPNQLCTSVLFLKIEHYSDVALKSIFFFVSINFATNTLKNRPLMHKKIFTAILKYFIICTVLLYTKLRIFISI